MAARRFYHRWLAQGLEQRGLPEPELLGLLGRDLLALVAKWRGWRRLKLVWELARAQGLPRSKQVWVWGARALVWEARALV